MPKLLFILLLNFFGAVGLAQTVDADSCATLVRFVRFSQDTAKMTACTDFYDANEQFDSPPGSFNNSLKLGFRVLKLKPFSKDFYRYVGTLLYNKWATWMNSPARMPDGKSCLEEFFRVWGAGLELFPNDSEFLQNYADDVRILAEFHEPPLITIAIEAYENADALSVRPAQKIRIRLNLAAIYRVMKDVLMEKYWYQQTLILDRDNEVANRNLRRISLSANGLLAQLTP